MTSRNKLLLPTDRLVLFPCVCSLNGVFLHLISWNTVWNKVSKCAFWVCGVGPNWSSTGQLESSKRTSNELVVVVVVAVVVLLLVLVLVG